MSDNKFSIDDILSEYSKSRNKAADNNEKNELKDISITGIIDEDEIQKSLDNSQSKKKGIRARQRQKTEEMTIENFMGIKLSKNKSENKSLEKIDIFQGNENDITPQQKRQVEKIKKIEAINKALKRKISDDTLSEDEFISEVNPIEKRKEKSELDFSLPPKEKTINVDDILTDNDDGTKKKEINNFNDENPLFIKNNFRQKEDFSEQKLIDTLNQRLVNPSLVKKSATISIPDENGVDLPPKALNIDYEKQILNDTSTIQLLQTEEKLMQAKTLEENKKKKIRDFVLENGEDDIEQDVDSEELHELSDDDSDVILSRLIYAKKGLTIRAVVMFLLSACAILISILNDFKVEMPFEFMSKLENSEGYLYMFLGFALASYMVCSTSINNGIVKLFTLKGDSDSIAALSFAVSTIGIIIQIMNKDYLSGGMTHIYISVSLLALFFNTIGKLLMIKTALKNFQFVAGDTHKYFIEAVSDEDADDIAKGSVVGVPHLAVMRKTEYLCDFLQSSYCYDRADKLSRVISPAVLIIGLLTGVLALLSNVPPTLMSDKLYWASTVANAFVVCATPFSMVMLISLPLYNISKTIPKSNAAILGYNCIEEYSHINSIAVDAATIFPSGSVVFKNLKRCQKKKSSTYVEVDEAILVAASLAIRAKSVLSPMFYDMIGGKNELLHKISGIVIEEGGGIMGWLGNKRIMLGNRNQMKHHQISLPSVEKEKQYSKGNETIYLAISGEAVTMFFVEFIANPEIKRYVQIMEIRDMGLVIRAMDSFITSEYIAELFEVEPSMIRILPKSINDKFDNCTAYSSKGRAALSCNGTFTAFAQAILGVKTVEKNINYGTIMLLASTVLGALLVMIFGLFIRYDLLTVTNILLFNIITTALVITSQHIDRTK